jgi:hypothetical protein
MGVAKAKKMPKKTLIQKINRYGPTKENTLLKIADLNMGLGWVDDIAK